MTVIDLTSGSTSSWIDQTTPPDGGVNVSRVDDLTIVFTRMVDVACLNNETFKLMDENGSYIDAFLPIETNNDYSPILQTLTLHLSGSLAGSTQYMLVISGLYDASGDTQDAIHTVQFITNDSVVPDWTPHISEVDTLQVEDHSIADSGVSITPAGHTVYLNPVDGSYNVARATQTLVATIYPDDVTSASAIVNRRAISQYELPWATVAATSDLVDNVLTITLPSYGEGYVEPGYEYQVVISVGIETYTMHFMGELSPMFSTVATALIQAPGASSYDIAKQIYIYSAAVLAINSSYETSPTRAVGDYVLYSSLLGLTALDSAVGYVLGDLEVTKKNEGNLSLWEKWKKLADEAYNRLIGSGPKFVVKGGSNTSPHAGRDWDAAGTTRRRIGKTE